MMMGAPRGILAWMDTTSAPSNSPDCPPSAKMLVGTKQEGGELTLLHEANGDGLMQLDGNLWVDRRSFGESAFVKARVDLGRL